MKSEKQILESRAAIVAQVKDKWADVKKENRSPNQEELDFFNKADADLIALTSERDAIVKDANSITEIETRIGKYESMLAETATVPQEVRSVRPGLAAPKPEVRSTLNKFLRHGYGELTHEERSVLGHATNVAEAELRGTSTLVSSTTTLGGFTMPEEWASELYKTMLWYGGALEAAGIKYHSSGGGDLHLPKVADTANVGAIITQGTGDVVLDTTFSELVLGAFGYTSKIIKLSIELIEDSAYDIQKEISDLAAIRIGRKLNTDLTVGDGSSKPLGMAAAAGAGKTAASATAVTRGEIIDLMHSVDKAHRMGPRVGFMFNDTTLAALKKLAFGTGDDRPLWVMSMREGAPDTLEGQRYFINNDMASMTTGLKSFLYGDFSKYIIRQVGGYLLARSTERYFEERAVAYFVFARFDGDLLDTAALKYLIQA